MQLPRKFIKGKFLEKLSQKDIRFIVTTLTSDGNEADSLLKLLTDEGTRKSILESDLLIQAVSSPDVAAKISQELYFYLLLRRALKAEGIPSNSVAVFLSEALAAFPPAPRPGVHTADYEAALKAVKDYEWFVLSVELANRSLILSGIYGDEIYKQKKNYPVAGLNRYENIGKSNYRAAARSNMAQEFDLRDTLNTLADNYIAARTALSNIRESYLKLTAGRA